MIGIEGDVSPNPEKSFIEKLANELGSSAAQAPAPAEVTPPSEPKNKDEEEPSAPPAYVDNTKPKDVEPELPKAEKTWYDDEGEEDAAKPVVDEELQKKYEELTGKINEYENNDLLKTIIDAQKNGKTIFDIVDELRSSDYSKLSDEDRYAKYFESEGLSGDDLEEEMEAFKGKTRLERKEIANKLREMDKAELDKKLTGLTKSTKELSTRERESIKATIQKGSVEYESFVEKVKSAPYYGLDINDARLEKITGDLNKSVKPMADGKNSIVVDSMQDAIDFFVWKNYKKDLMRANIEKAKSDGRLEVIKDRVRPSTQDAPTHTAKQKTRDEEFDEALSHHLKKETKGLIGIKES